MSCFPIWIFVVVISLWVSLAAFIWGAVSGQFADQERARYLPFAAEGESLRPTTPPTGGKAQKIFYLFLLATAAVFFATVAGMAIYYQTAG